ncbi:MAG: hypothetical protein KBD76_14800 [Bacteriovorax sp.]|jgi:hypothetical protein|nr:hypothetical protein [Bacteriovorax sp.]
MSKKLDLIIKKVPHATSRESFSVNKINNKEEKMERIVAVVPSSLKKQIKQYILDHPGDTEKTVLLKGLISMGFLVNEKFLKDNRGRRYDL